MRVGIAVWPKDSAEWLELGISSKFGIEVEIIGQSVKDPVQPIHLVVVDGDNPGPFFLGYHRALISGFGMPSSIVLGTPESPAVRAMELDAAQTVYIPKPYEIESVMNQVLKKSESFQGTEDEEQEKESPSEKKTLGYLSTLALSDLIQMLCISDWTGMVCVEHLKSGVKGYLFISEGALYHAEAGSLNGLQACYHMLRWHRCQYSFNEEKVLDVVTIQIPWQEVMLEGARQIDEDA